MAAPMSFRTLLLILFTSYFTALPTSATAPALVVGQSTVLQLTPSLVVRGSPGSRPGVKVVCDRVEIHGLPRLKKLGKFAYSVKVNASFVNSSSRPPNTEICFHRNASLGIGMCPPGQWEKLTKGTWVRSMSPFDHKLLDVRMIGSSSEKLEVSLHEEFFLYRVILLIVGIVLMTYASSLSHSLVFYYGSAMTVGVILVILMILFQGMRLLPTGRKSSLAIVLYSSVIGVGSFLLTYVPKLLRSMLLEMGIGEDLYTPLAVFVAAFIVLAGAWVGFWVVRKLVLTEDGSIDTGVANFVTWSICIFASVMILQSSVDPLLAIGALAGGIVLSSLLRKVIRPSFILHMYRLMGDCIEHLGSFSFGDFTIQKPKNSHFMRPRSGSVSNTSGTPNSRPSWLSDSDTYFSTFHSTPERKKFSKDEWDNFTKESTKRELEQLVSSPGFTRWAVAHADRITLRPEEGNSKLRRRSWFS